MILKDQIPKVYQQLFPKKLLHLDPAEPLATCHACARTREKYRGKYPYKADLKCCTFEPWIPNFVVGELLLENADKIKDIQLQMQHKISTRQYMLPLGAVPSLIYQVKFNHRKPEDFGQDESLLCSYYDRQTELCKLWRYRGSVCTSYHCKSVHSHAGRRFWKQMENYLSYVEMALMEDALVCLDFSPRQVSHLLNFLNQFEADPADLQSTSIDHKKWIELWNGYENDIPGFYIKCFKHISSMSRKDYELALGETGEHLEVELLEHSKIWSSHD